MAINVTEFNAALEQLEITKGISRDVVLEALKEAMIKGFKKDIGDDEAIVEVNIDLERGIIEMYQIKTVVEDAEDILLEISLEDANKDGGKYKIGDEYRIAASPENLRKAIVLSIKSILRQKFAEAEKEILFEQFKDKIGTMITGRVEQFDERGASINIGKTSVYMSKKDLIRGERFLVGDTIKLYVVNVESSSKGAHIHVSRSDEGFLKALMTEEIHDIYDGTIVIKAVAREAGERSKVAVYCEDPNIDPAGTCIGPNGSRIQKVVSQLGNNQQKEKIDIIAYSDKPELFIMEALKPAQVLGIKLSDTDEVDRSGNKFAGAALVVVKDESFTVAIGRGGLNVKLASKLTKYKIDIKTETEALETGIEYVSFDDIAALELEEKAARIAQAQRESLVYQGDARGPLPGVPEGYVAPQERKYEDEENDFDSTLEEVAESEELTSTPAEVEEPVEEVKEEAPANEAPAEEENKEVEVKTTTTIDELEKSLESSGKKEKANKGKKKNKKSEEETEEQQAVVHDGPRMSIYTEEELREMEEEEQEVDEDIEDDDIDYDEYDQYYDED